MHARGRPHPKQSTDQNNSKGIGLGNSGWCSGERWRAGCAVCVLLQRPGWGWLLTSMVFLLRSCRSWDSSTFSGPPSSSRSAHGSPDVTGRRRHVYCRREYRTHLATSGAWHAWMCQLPRRCSPAHHRLPRCGRQQTPRFRHPSIAPAAVGGVMAVSTSVAVNVCS
jgi:hypothetical protein